MNKIIMKVKTKSKKKYINILIFLLLLTLIGCNNTEIEVKVNNDFNQISLFQIYINGDGDLVSPSDKNIIKNEERYIDNILKNYYKYKRYYKDLKLMIYIHGGLNNYSSSMERSNSILNNNLEEILRSGKYPVFVSWDSSFVDNYLDHVLRLKQGEKNVFTYSASPFVILKDVLRSVVKVPENAYNSLTRSKNTPNEKFKHNKEFYSETLSYVEENFNLSSSKVYENNKWEAVKENWSIANPSKVLGGAVADSIGKGTYRSMLRRTDLLLEKNIDMKKPPSLYNPNKYNLIRENETALSYFLRRYMEIEKESVTPNTKRYGNVVLIGHSMGSMVSNNIISKFQDINFEEIVYMGAACSLKDIQYTISPYLESNKNAKFYSLSLDTKRELNENMGNDFVPRGSLLVYLDQMYENVNSFLDRASGIWWNMIIAANNIFPNDVRDRVTLVKFGFYNDHTKAPQKHGEFDDFKFWNKEYWKAEDQRSESLYIYKEKN